MNRPPDETVRSWTRRRFLATGLLAGGAVAAAGAANWIAGLLAPPSASSGAAPSGLSDVAGLASVAASATAGSPRSAPPAPRHTFISRPDLSAPVVSVDVVRGGTDAGFIFFTPNNGTSPDGLLVLDDSGQPVWIRSDARPAVANFQVTARHGQPTLAWWEGIVNGGLGSGEFVLAGAGYGETARIRAGHGLTADLHEFQLTPNDTALILTGRQTAVPAPDGATPLPYQAWEGIIQEIDIASGAVRFEWHSLDHVGIDESFTPPPSDGHTVFDYLHLNSIDVDADDSLLVSARNTSTIYKIDRTTGEIRWRLGGRQSDFRIEERAVFGWQHDARRRPDGRLSLFDDQTPPTPSRGLFLRVDESAMVATLDAEYHHPRGLAAASQGNLEVLPSGNVFIGWGSSGAFSEFQPDGTLLYDVSFAGSKQSYRCFRSAWVGRPVEPPALTVVGRGAEPVEAAVSWNGATDVAAWVIHAGPTRDGLVARRTAPRSGFETLVSVDDPGPWFAAEAIDAAGAVLGRSSAVTVSD